MLYPNILQTHTHTHTAREKEKRNQEEMIKDGGQGWLAVTGTKTPLM